MMMIMMVMAVVMVVMVVRMTLCLCPGQRQAIAGKSVRGTHEQRPDGLLPEQPAPQS